MAVADMAMDGISVRLLPGLPGRPGLARAMAYQSAPPDSRYCTYIDPDDRYPSGAAHALADALDACPAAPFAFSQERLMRADGRVVTPATPGAYDIGRHAAGPGHVHGLILLRRSCITQAFIAHLSTVVRHGTWAMTRWLVDHFGVPVLVPVVGRHWRQHRGQWSSIQRRPAF